ncbi:MAG: DASS family sodium-coupled anion symporter [Pyrinomonadaceae bacterium]
MPSIEESEYEQGDSRFDVLRARAGLVLGPVLFFAVLLYPFDIKPEAHRLAAVIILVITLWICESIPMPVTALIGAVLAVALKVAPVQQVFAPFGDPLIFLFVGSFILARGIFLHQLDKRFAYSVLSLKWIDGRPERILFAFGAVTAFASAWLSNTATTAMMFAIGLSIIAFLKKQEDKSGRPFSKEFATVLMLITSFAATIGGLMTPIGTPPNVIGIGFIRKQLGRDISFFKWMMFAAPIAIVLYFALYFYFRYISAGSTPKIEGCREMVAKERTKLGSWTRGQKSTLAAFLVTVLIWVLSGFVALVIGETAPFYKLLREVLPESTAALIGASLLFFLPGNKKGEKAIDWSEAVKIDWGVVLLYAGGFTLGVLSFKTGLAEEFGRSLTNLVPSAGEFVLLSASVIVAVMISETTSNTASANMVVPVVIALANAKGLDPLVPALGATLGASLGFMLPVSTPCNAIVYGSGHIPLMKMVRYGVLLDVFGAIVIIAMLTLMSAWIR